MSDDIHKETPTPRVDAFTSALYNESCAAAAGMGGLARSPEECYGLAVDLARELEREFREGESPSSAWDRCAERAAQIGERQCEAIQQYGATCDAFVRRGMRCPECPRDYADEIRELIGKYETPTGGEHDSQGGEDG